MRISFVVLLLFLFACRLVSQTTASATLLSVKDGLSHGVVFDILQSRDGFIWIATQDGLNRYDGARFEVFSHDPFNPFTIGSGAIQNIFEDSRGWIWVALPEGLDVFDPVSGRFFHIKHKGLPVFSRWTGSMAETADGTIWLSDSDRIWKINAQKDMLAKAAKQSSANLEPTCKPISLPAISGWGGALTASHLLFTRGQKLLVGTEHDGLFRLDPSTEQIFPELAIPDCEIETISESKSGVILVKGNKYGPHIWIRIEGNNVQYRRDSSPDYPFGSIRIVHVEEGYFWMFRGRSFQKWKMSVFFNNGEPEMEISADGLLPGYPEDYAATCYTTDKSGIIWAGTNGFGIVKIKEEKPRFKTLLSEGESHELLLEDPEGGLYTSGMGDKKFLSKHFDRSVPNTHIPLSLGSNNSKAVAFDQKGNFWCLTYKEILLRVDAVTKTVKKIPFEGYSMICKRNGLLVGVDEKGLHEFDPASETSQHFRFDQPQQSRADGLPFLYEDSEATVWVFGYKGLIKSTRSQSGYRFEYFSTNPEDPSSLSSNVVLSVADDPIEPRRYLWVGTDGCGLNRLDKSSGKFKHYTRKQGLPDEVVRGILAQNWFGKNQAPGYIWMSTDQGLCRFDVRAETATNFTVEDGLQDNEFLTGSYLKTKDGSLIFGGPFGINVFHPDSLYFNKILPKTIIAGLKVNNQKIDIAGKSSIRLSHDQNFLSFDFAALEFTNPVQNQYRYQLVGADKEWIYLGKESSIQFANLAPGTYTFKVLGSNNDGIWSEQPAEFSFKILPPWWNSWWAYTIYLALAAAGIWQYYQYQLRQRFSEQEKLRLQELDDFKSHFFTNISHEFRTPLTVILGMTERLTVEGGRLTESEAKNNLGLIKRNGKNLLRLINQILDLAKLESNTLKINYIQGDVLAFLKYIAESLHSLANAQNLMLRVESEQAKIVMDYDPERFLQIIHNLLSNAIKFTPSGGKVVLRADLKDQWLQLSVADSGAGIPPEELPHLFERFFQAKNQEYAKAGGAGIGLSLTRELVKVMGGEISVESQVGKGTTFIVRLPVTRKAEYLNIRGFEDLNPSPLEPSNLQILKSSNPQILLIEDNPDVVEYLSACLSSPFGGGREGAYQLAFAYNGQAGIEKALENVPDLIVSDVMMPIKDGFEVVETLKNDERTSHIPIVLLTAKADVESRIKGLRRGADAYLSKPFHQEELLATLENLLEQRRKLQEKFLSQQLAVGSQLPTTDTPLPTAELPTADLTLEDAFLQKFRAIVEANLSDPDFEMPQLERALGMSRSQIFRKVKALTGKSPSLFIRSIRLHHSRHLLQTTTLTVSEIAYEVGYSAPNNFSDAFMEEFGERPTAVRR
jgi:signal transduction histidine kinase/DNA-binding response OmpR family regulator/streptogramin lyase